MTALTALQALCACLHGKAIAGTTTSRIWASLAVSALNRVRIEKALHVHVVIPG